MASAIDDRADLFHTRHGKMAGVFLFCVCQGARICVIIHITNISQRENLTTQTITLNRKKYAVGLFWQPLPTGAVARNFAHNLARSVNKKLNLFVEYRAMVGLGSRKMGMRSSMPVAAAEVVDAFSEYSSFLAVFQVGTLFYLVAVRNGIILRDQIFDIEKNARAEYVKMAEMPDWAAFFAPAAWGMPRAVERNLSEIVRARPQLTLHSISRFRTIGFSVFLAAAFLCALIVMFGKPFMQPRPRVATLDPEKAAEYKRRIEEKNRQLDVEFNIEKPLPPEPIVMPFENLPDVAARAALCYQAIGFLMQPIVGWVQTNASCDDAYVVADARRSFGTIGDFYAIAGELMPGTFVQERGEDALTMRATLPSLPLYASQDERDAETVVRDVMSAFQSISADANADIVVDVLTNGVETQSVNVVEISASSKLAPVQFMQIFDGFGGVYMSRAQWIATSRTWNYEVIIYAK